MNTRCHPPASPLAPLAPQAPTRPGRFAWPGFNRLIQIARPLAVDLSHFLYTDRPEQGSSPRTILTHYR